jgi:hypothetical protein
MVVRAGWDWAAVEGPADLAGPDDGLPGLDAERIRVLLREIFTAAGGIHDGWDTLRPGHGGRAPHRGPDSPGTGLLPLVIPPRSGGVRGWSVAVERVAVGAGSGGGAVGVQG